MDIAQLRIDYKLAALDITDVDASPFVQFEKWFQASLAAQSVEGNAMTLATVNAAGKPSARIVLLKDFDTRGATFFTNYDSDKGQDLAANPAAALVFFWPELERQIRIEGRVEKVSAEESDQYFGIRPAQSQIGAWASPQSREIASREVIAQRVSELTRQYPNTPPTPPRPPFWGGYRVVPNRFEFWQGRASRLHDRICYLLQDGGWGIVRLAP